MRKYLGIVLASLTWANAAVAEPPRVHVTAGAAHAVGGSQQREFGAGGGGTASVELPIGQVLGVQASGGALVLTPGDTPDDPGFAKKSAGTAFLGTVGVRFRPLGARRVAGPWVDANGGVAQTGSEARMALDAHVGWDFRVSRSSRWDVGPFVGFTQIVQPDSALRPDDARVLWAGIQISLGASDKPRGAPIPTREEPVPALEDRDGIAEVETACPPIEEGAPIPDGCSTPVVALVGDRLVIDDIIHFGFNTPTIEPRSYVLVARVARFIKDNPNILEISIEGHADARGTDAYNQRLSEARAASTRELLVRFGVAEPRLRALGHGKSQLKVPTLHAEQRNRRVEFIVTKSAPRPDAIAAGERGTP